MDDRDPKVVSLEERLKGRGKDPAGTGPVQMPSRWRPYSKRLLNECAA
jgi:hypothetical protein